MRIDIPAIAPQTQSQRSQGPTASLVENLSRDFGHMINEVNRLGAESDQKIEEFATSPDKDIHGTLIAMEKAGLSMRLMLQVRSKLTNAFQELMRTPV
jgi:flagellar hook-basal body complex protein FliE